MAASATGITVDTRVLNRRVKEATARSPRARLAALKEAVELVVKRVVLTARRDTRRYVRAWIIAANQAGLWYNTPPAVQRSRFADKLKDRLEIQLDREVMWLRRTEASLKFWEERYNLWYGRTGRRGKWERDCRAKRDKARKNVERQKKLVEQARAELAKYASGNEGQLVVFRRRAKSRRNITVTVREKIYGGSGEAVSEGDRAVITLRNLEPHARIVEKRYGTVTRADRAERPRAVRRVKETYRKVARL